MRRKNILHSTMRSILIHFFLLVSVLAQMPASALESPAVISPRSTVTLLAAQTAAVAGQPVDLALRLQLAPGWHIYWMNPGDAGQPPQIGVHAPAGSTVSDIGWPAPRRHVDAQITTFIHEGDVTLPFSLTLPADVRGVVPIAVTATWLICKDICIPEEGAFQLSLPVGTPAPSPHAARFDAAERARPSLAPWQAVVDRGAVLSLSGDGVGQIVEAWFLPAVWGMVEHGAAQTLEFKDDVLRLAMQAGPAFDASGQLAGALLTRDRQGIEQAFWIETPGSAVERPVSVRWVSARMPAAPAPAYVPTVSDTAGIAYALLFALAGGLLLNLMPCVFPVLAIKALSFARMGGHARQAVRMQSIAYCAGVVTTFVLLAALLLGLRAAGMQAGWGFQFQSPLFVTGMATLLFVIGLNLSGVFDFASGLSSAGGSLTTRPGLSGSFFTGALAVVVATPCTAPFMGGAIAFALGAPAQQTLAVFVAMGFGLAMPYVLMAFFPGAARRMPRPGAWMDRLKQALAFPMYAAVAWLVWVLSRQSGADGVLVVLVVLLLVALASWLLGVAQRSASQGMAWRIAALMAAAGAAFAFGSAPESTPSPAAVPGSAEASGSIAYSADGLAALRAAGKPVFVNMTAAWCVTCLLNEKVALSTQGVQQAFAQRGITYMKGDWTRSDPEITRFLREHGRDGVPLYVYFPSGAGSGKVLPQILTERIVLDGIEP
jgi:thiol:disulfide interchange protein/DsbC/DsbD-like thiol-disulfide interchange protein